MAVPAQADESAFDYRSAIQAATAALEREHYTRRKLDDKLSAEWLAAFIAQLDPRRMYFLQTDVADFQAFEHRLDDHAKTGDFQFPELVRTRFRERVASATATAVTLTDARHDFTADETLPRRFDAFAQTDAELRERWRLRIKGELLIEKVHGRLLAEVQAQLRGRYERIARQARDLSDAQLCQIYLNSLARLCDPHSTYFGYGYGFHRPTYGIGILLREDEGRYLIAGVRSALNNDDSESLIGWELTALKRPNGKVIDLVETLPRHKAFEFIRSPIGPLETDSRVVLELLNPVTLQRKSVEWPRFRY
jgi:hypothetical protein